MAVDSIRELTPRQREILARVVEEYVATGQPVGSKHLVERAGLSISPSTVRNELAELEALGLLSHPHTSAGRVPTERGYRFYADELLARQDPRPGRFPLDLSALRREVDSALEATTEMLSQVTRLLALVSAPPLETSTVRHVEVLLLQPQTVMVVVITSTGGVTKRIFTFETAVDPGLAVWAGEYLNERLSGLRLGTRRLRNQLDDPSLSAGERAFVMVLRSAFVDVVEAEQRLYVGGAAGWLDDVPDAELGVYRRLLATLEKRAALLEVLGRSLDPRRPFVRFGGELAHPAFHDVALVGATYGLTNQVLGAVSLLGPVRMDYEKAIRSVRGAAFELSRFVEEVYEDN
jgi:heat-inducible transcriptional repressor